VLGQFATVFVLSRLPAKKTCPSLLIYHADEGFMDTSIAARRTEDIALDLLKFIASTANVVKNHGGGTPGFGGASSPKGEDQVTQLLDLYSKCRQAVEAPAK
jgi:hypothetical protein